MWCLIELGQVLQLRSLASSKIADARIAESTMFSIGSTVVRSLTTKEAGWYLRAFSRKLSLQGRSPCCTPSCGCLRLMLFCQKATFKSEEGKRRRLSSKLQMARFIQMDRLFVVLVKGCGAQGVLLCSTHPSTES